MKKILPMAILLWGALPLSASSVPSTPPAHIITLTGQKILYSNLVTADFNGDGYKEIVAGGSDGMLYVISTSDGTNWNVVWQRQGNDDIEAANPPTSRKANEIVSSPAVGDLDNDGDPDIVVAMGGDIHVEDIAEKENGGVLVYRFNGPWDFSLMEPLSADGSRGWPQPRIDAVGKHPGFGFPDGFWDGIVTTPALADLDGDNDLEIIVAGIDRRIHAWHHTGEVVAGWPIYRYNEDGSLKDVLLRGGLSSPAVGDLDRDGLPEVVVATMSPPWNGVTAPNYNYATIWALNGDSSYVPGFPIATEQWFHSSAALGDIDGDGYLEIVIGSGGDGLPGRRNIVSAYNHDGSALPNWPREALGVMPGSPSLADIDNDGLPEVIAGCGSKYSRVDCGNGTAKLYVWNWDGSTVPGFPAQPPSASPWDNGAAYSMPFSPIVGDYDGDGASEIIVSQTGSWGLTIVGVNGLTEATRQLNRQGSFMFSAPVLDDIDNDGRVEIIAGAGDESNGEIYIWDEQGRASSASPWPMSRQNAWRIGAMPDNLHLYLYPPPLKGQTLPPIYDIILDD